MAWAPISLFVPQYTANGAAASGFVLKAYEAGTATNTAFATDSTGATQATSIALNSDGFPEVSGNVVIPHIDQTFKLALYPTQAAADANSGSTWSIDSLQPITNVAFGNSVNAQTANYTLLTSDKGKLIYYSGAGGVTVSAMAAADAGDGFTFLLENDTSGTVTFDPDGAEQVNGTTTHVVSAGTAAMVVCNGTSWRAMEWVSETGTQTLTNKTLTSPVINGTATGSGTLGGSIVVPLARSVRTAWSETSGTSTSLGLDIGTVVADDIVHMSVWGTFALSAAVDDHGYWTLGKTAGTAVIASGNTHRIGSTTTTAISANYYFSGGAIYKVTTGGTLTVGITGRTFPLATINSNTMYVAAYVVRGSS